MTRAVFQPAAFRFHDNHGENIVLTNNQQTAERRGRGDGDGIVVSCDPMEVNTLYEVRTEAWDSVHPFVDMGHC